MFLIGMPWSKDPFAGVINRDLNNPHAKVPTNKLRFDQVAAVLHSVCSTLGIPTLFHGRMFVRHDCALNGPNWKARWSSQLPARQIDSCPIEPWKYGS